MQFILTAFAAGWLIAAPAAAAAQPTPNRVADLAAALGAQGRDPVDYVVDALAAHDLVVFDEGLHTAKEPWDFYSVLVRDPRIGAAAPTVFVEVIPYNQQSHVDAYLASDDGDVALLLPALRDAHVTGWANQTYLDFFAAVHAANRALPSDGKIRVMGVAPASWWPEITSAEDYRHYRTAGFADYDAGMAARIEQALDGFESGLKGLFLTNTRHAYTALRDADGELFGNATTLLREDHGDAVWSVRINAPFLEVKARSGDTDALGQGLAGVDYGWTRADAGAWDAAFAALGDAPVAIELSSTPFGDAPYVGNRMLSAAAGQTMADVNDAVIHLAPVDGMTQTGFSAALFDDAFKAELARRLPLAFTAEQLDDMMTQEGVETLEALVDAMSTGRPAEPLPQAAALPPL